MFRFFRRKKTEPVVNPESQALEQVESDKAEITDVPTSAIAEPSAQGDEQRQESPTETLGASSTSLGQEKPLESSTQDTEQIRHTPRLEDADIELAQASEDDGLVDMSNPNAAQQTGDVWMAAQAKLEPVPDEPEELLDNSQPAPDADGKIRLRFSLDDSGFGGVSDISDEELEAAALAEIPEDSPERYRHEPEETWDDNVEDEDESEQSDADTNVLGVASVITTATSELTDATVAEVVDEEPKQASLSATPEAEKVSWLGRLKRGLSRTGSSISAIFVGVKVDEELFEELETALIMADSGVEATQSLLTKLRAKVKKDHIENAADVKKALHVLLTEHLQPLEKTFMLAQDATNVVMIAGVNGAGKTTSIGKLAHHFQANGASVLLAAGDTFRAAAREQLIEWGSRNNVQVIAQEGGDPAAVAFDAVNAGRARRNNVVMVDTAGRLPTQLHLMEELKKIRRVINRADASAPHEVLLVVDGNTGQNAIAQIRAFDAVLNLTGLVVTKLDGTAKGGILAAVAAGSQDVRPIPVYWIGVGEGLHDLQPFKASEFATALLGD